MNRIVVGMFFAMVVLFATSTVYDVDLSYNDTLFAISATQTFIATADSIDTVSFFCGREITSGQYQFKLYDADGNELPNSPIANCDAAGNKYKLVSAGFNQRVFVRKGFTYRLYVEHSDDSIINFYFNRHNTYKNGQLLYQPDSFDLAARIKGVNNFPGGIFGCQSVMVVTPNQDPDSLPYKNYWESCVNRMKETGIKWERVGMCAWQHFQFYNRNFNDTVYIWGWCDSLMQDYAQDTMKVLWYFCNSTRWASCCDSIDTLHHLYVEPPDSYWGEWYDGMPKNLYEPVLDTTGDINFDNYFARYVYKFVIRYGPDGEYWDSFPALPYNPIRYYEMWNEPEYAICNIGDGSYWSNDSVFDTYYDSLRAYDTSPRKKNSFMDLYARLCIVGDSAAHKALADNQSSDSIFIMAYEPYRDLKFANTLDPRDSLNSIGPGEWLVGMNSRHINDYCEGLSFHSYIYDTNDTVNYNRHKKRLDAIWELMKTNNFGNKFLWNTEYGTHDIPQGSGPEVFNRQADLTLAAFTNFLANVNPKGPLVHSSLWAFSTLYFGDGWEDCCWSITNDAFNYRPTGFAYQQMTSLLKDCRFGQCLVNDSMQYDSIRVYEFFNTETNKNIYVGWKEPNRGTGTRAFNIPLRTTSGKVEKIAYNSSPNITPVNINSAGWAVVNLDTIPRFIYEPADSALRRSDLIIDSIWTNPFFPCDSDSVVTYARIKNIGTATTLDSIFVRFAINGDTISTELIDSDIPPDSTATIYAGSKWLSVHGSYLVRADVNACKKFVELDFNNNTRYRHYSVPLRPYGTIKINRDSSYTNVPYVILCLSGIDPNDSLNPNVDSMKIWQTYTQNDTLYEYALPMMAYDTICFWYLREGENTNKVYVKYKVNPGYESHPIDDQITFDKTAPESSFVLNDNDRFSDSTWVTVNNNLVDTLSGLSRMRYGHDFLKNIVINSSFESRDTINWKTDTAVFIDSLKLFKIPLHTIGNYFYQAIPLDSLTEFDNDTMLLAIDLVSDSFKGTGKVQFQYIYGTNPDSCPPRGGQQPYPYGTSITIPQGTKANVSQYNHYSYFKYHPDPLPGTSFLEARIGVFVDSSSSNSGRLYIDNLRLDVVGPPPDYEHFVGYASDTSKDLLSNGYKILYGQFQDGAGNETAVLFDSIIVDTTHPSAFISSPESDQTVWDTVEITGSAYDPNDDISLFHHYDLKYKSCNYEDWYGCEPDSYSTTAKYPSFPMPLLGDWDTYKASETWGDGWFDLKLSDLDSASNTAEWPIIVYIDNYPEDTGDIGIGRFGNEVYGLTNNADIFIGEYGTGKIYRYNQSHQLTDTFQLVDSLGIGFPYALIQDDSNYLWIANLKSHKISKYTPQGALIKRFGGDFNQPSGITMDKQGNLWITDRQHHKVKKFSPDGIKLFEFGERGNDPGKLNQPIGIALKDSLVYVADSKNQRISVFDTTGSFKRTIGANAGFELPCGLAIDTTGCLFISDFTGNKIIEFGPYDNRILKIDTLLNGPAALTLSADQKTLYVTDAKNKRVVAFKVRGTPPQHGGSQAAGEKPLTTTMFGVYPTVFSKRLYIRLQGVTGKNLSLKVYDVTGRLVKNLLNPVVLKSDMVINWNAKDDHNRAVPCGIYIIQADIAKKKVTAKAILLK